MTNGRRSEARASAASYPENDNRKRQPKTTASEVTARRAGARLPDPDPENENGFFKADEPSRRQNYPFWFSFWFSGNAEEGLNALSEARRPSS
jgi:hypothetical protein